MRNYLSEQYAAPEQWLGVRAEHPTDIYALGCIAFELLTGAPPFKGPNFAHQHRAEVAVLTAGEPLLRSLVRDMLAPPGPDPVPIVLDAEALRRELETADADEVHRAEERVQKVTDEHVKRIDDTLKGKEAEILEV